MPQKIIGVIPARAGSKGLPNKNVRRIAGKPLLAWSIESAKKSKLLKDFFVSTENPIISRIAKKYGSKVIKRPDCLATDSANIMDVLVHAQKKTKADIIVLLQPTSPIRNPRLIDLCITRYLNRGHDSLATGFLCKVEPYKPDMKFHRRQDKKGFFYDDGNIYVLSKELVKRKKKRGIKPCELIISREENMEIDDSHDFFLAEQLLLKRGKG